MSTDGIKISGHHVDLIVVLTKRSSWRCVNLWKEKKIKKENHDYVINEKIQQKNKKKQNKKKNKKKTAALRIED